MPFNMNHVKHLFALNTIHEHKVALLKIHFSYPARSEEDTSSSAFKSQEEIIHVQFKLHTIPPRHEQILSREALKSRQSRRVAFRDRGGVEVLVSRGPLHSSRFLSN